MASCLILQLKLVVSFYLFDVLPVFSHLLFVLFLLFLLLHLNLIESLVKEVELYSDHQVKHK